MPEPSGVVYNGSRYGESGIGHQQSGAILRPRHVANTMPLSVQQARDAGRECVCVSLAKTIAHHRRSREPAGIPLHGAGGHMKHVFKRPPRIDIAY